MTKKELNGFTEAVRTVVREELKPIEQRLDKRLDDLKKEIPGLVADVIAQRFPTLFPHS